MTSSRWDSTTAWTSPVPRWAAPGWRASTPTTPGARYREALAGVVGCALAVDGDVRSAHHLFTIVLPEGVDRDAFRGRLADARVQTSVHYQPVHRFAIHTDGSVLPVTERYARTTVTLPLFAHMTEAQQDRVVAAVVAALGDR